MAQYLGIAKAAFEGVLNAPQTQEVLKAVSWQQLSNLQAVLSHPTTLTASMIVVLVITTYLANVVTGYWSWVDRLWSILPGVVALIYAYHGNGDIRVNIMTALILAWCIRLTRNFARKGGYGHEEDYRWPILRKFFEDHDPFHPLGRELFNLLFVAAFQLPLIAAFAALPLHAAWAVRGTVPLGPVDGLCVVMFLAALYGEHVTDEAQWAFQTAKYALSPAQRAKAGGDIARGFCATGPFRYSRHLNFFCEQSMWWIMSALGGLATGLPLLNYTWAGALVLSGLFQGSTNMTEQVTAAKYPAYSAYQRTTSRLMPWWPGVSLDSKEGQAMVASAEAVAAARAAGGKKKAA